MGGTVDGDREAGLPPLAWPLRHAGELSRPDLNTHSHSQKVRFFDACGLRLLGLRIRDDGSKMSKVGMAVGCFAVTRQQIHNWRDGGRVGNEPESELFGAAAQIAAMVHDVRAAHQASRSRERGRRRRGGRQPRMQLQTD